MINFVGGRALEIPGGCFQSAIVFEKRLPVLIRYIVQWLWRECRRGALQVAPPTSGTYISVCTIHTWILVHMYTQSLNCRNWGNANHRADLLRMCLASSWPQRGRKAGRCMLRNITWERPSLKAPGKLMWNTSVLPWHGNVVGLWTCKCTYMIRSVRITVPRRLALHQLSRVNTAARWVLLFLFGRDDFGRRVSWFDFKIFIWLRLIYELTLIHGTGIYGYVCTFNP